MNPKQDPHLIVFFVNWKTGLLLQMIAMKKRQYSKQNTFLGLFLPSHV